LRALRKHSWSANKIPQFQKPYRAEQQSSTRHGWSTPWPNATWWHIYLSTYKVPGWMLSTLLGLVAGRA